MLFWILTGAMSLIALGFIVVPLLRGTGSAELARAEAALRTAHAAGVLSDQELASKQTALRQASPAPTARIPRPLVLAIAVLLPFSAGALYYTLGEPRALDPSATAAVSAATPASGEQAPPDMDQAVAGLAEKMQSDPDNLDGWLLLGRAYKSMERFAPAREALANAYRIAPDDPDVLVEYAEASALDSSERRIEGEALTMIDRALQLQPEHQRGLWLRGVAAMQAGDAAKAVQTWETLRGLLKEADAVASIDEQIAGAREAAGMPAAPSATPAAPASSADGAAPAAAANTARLTVTVDISAELRAKLAPSDVLFVFARAVEGPKMPLAIQRLSASELPVTVVLDDSTSMMPQLKLSNLPQVVVGARVSKSGLATPQSGDFEVFSAAISSSRSEPLALTIDTVVP